MKDNLTAEWLREVLDYDPDTGDFIWRVALARNVVGQILRAYGWSIERAVETPVQRSGRA